MRANGHSLWLRPEAELGDRLAALIADLARRLGTPAFAPHLTLLGGIPGAEADVLRATTLLAARLPSLTIRLGDATGSDAYFRCVVVAAEATPELQTARAQAAAAFGLPVPPFFPHLSLVYGALPAATRDAVVGKIGSSLAGSFEARAVHLWRTEGEVAEWGPAGCIDLRG